LWPGSLGGTYGGNAVATAAASATLDVIENENLVENARRQGSLLEKRLKQLQSAVGKMVVKVVQILAMSSSFYIVSWYVRNVRCVDLRIEAIRWSGSDLWWVNSLCSVGVLWGLE